MAEKRKPALIMLLRTPGNRRMRKIELFPSAMWTKPGYYPNRTWRIRKDGKWFDKSKDFPKNRTRYFTKWQIRDMLFRSILK